jgi:hypothetical protein
MKKVFFAIALCSGLIVAASCTSQKLSQGEKENQRNKNHQKTGYWVETDSGSVVFEMHRSIGTKRIRIDTSKHTNANVICEVTDEDTVKSTSYYLITAKGYYQNDRKYGEWKYYIRDTSLVKKEFYTKNSIDSICLYNLKGKLIMEGKADYQNGNFLYKKYSPSKSNGSFPLGLFHNRNLSWLYE